MRRLLDHIGNNLIGYLALFVALGGTGYAATHLPAGSVTPATFNRHLIGGYVRAWAVTNDQCQVVASSPRAVETPKGGCPPGEGPYGITWKGKFPKQRTACVAIGVAGDQPALGSPPPVIYGSYQGHGVVTMTVFNPRPPGEGVNVALIC